MARGGDGALDLWSGVNRNIVHHDETRSTGLKRVHRREKPVFDPIKEILGVEVSFAYFCAVGKISPHGISRENRPRPPSVDGASVPSLVANWCVAVMPPPGFLVENGLINEN